MYQVGPIYLVGDGSIYERCPCITVMEMAALFVLGIKTRDDEFIAEAVS